MTKARAAMVNTSSAGRANIRGFSASGLPVDGKVLADAGRFCFERNQLMRKFVIVVVPKGRHSSHHATHNILGSSRQFPQVACKSSAYIITTGLSVVKFNPRTSRFARSLLLKPMCLPIPFHEQELGGGATNVRHEDNLQASRQVVKGSGKALRFFLVRFVGGRDDGDIGSAGNVE